MAKSARATTTKNNKQRLKKNVFGPIESARTERLSARLLELAAQPKPERDTAMEDVEENKEDEAEVQAAESNAMEVDSTAKGPIKTKKQQTKKRIEKRKSKKSSIVFPKYGERRSTRKR